MIVLISALIILVHTILSCKRLVYGLASFMAVRVLVPETMRSPIQSLSLNSLLIVILLLVTIFAGKFSIWKIKKDMLGKALLLFIFLPIIFLPFSDYLDLGMQVRGWLQIFLTDIMPALLAICILKTVKDLDIIIKGIFFTMILSLCYGVYSFVSNSNPWADYIKSYYATYDVSGVVNEQAEYTDLTRKTTSTFVSTNCFGYYLTYMFAFMLLMKNKISKNKWVLSLLLILVCMVFSTKRSPIVTLMFILTYLLRYRKKLIFPIVIIFTILLILLFTIPALENAKTFFMTAVFFWDDSYADSVDVHGSNMELRIRQVLYPFVEIKDNLLFGHGWGWCSVYLVVHKSIHPQLYGFETIFSTAICELGIMGIFLFVYLFLVAYRYIKNIRVDEKINYALLFVLSILVLYIATGAMYIYFFFILLVVLYKSSTFNGYINKKLF